MAILINNTKHAIAIGSVFLVPLVPKEVGDVDKLKSKYASIAHLMANGDIAMVTEKEAEKATENLAEQTLKQLKDIAVTKGIDVKGMKKADIIKALEG